MYRQFPKLLSGMPQRFLLFVLILVSGTTIAVETIQFQHYMEDQLGREKQRLSIKSSRATQHVADTIEFSQNQVAALAELPLIQELIKARQNGDVDSNGRSKEQYWKELLKHNFISVMVHNKRYHQIRFIGKANNGREIIRVQNIDGKPHVILEENLQEKGAESYFQKTLKAPKNAVLLSDLDLNREHGIIEVPHRPVLRVSTPVHDPDGNIFGMIVANVLTKQVFETMSKSFPNDIQFFITNQAGVYVHHSENSKTYGMYLGKDYTIQKDFPEVADFLEDKSMMSKSAIYTKNDNKYVVNLLKFPFDKMNSDRFLLIATFSPEAKLVTLAMDALLDIVIVACVVMFIGAVCAFLGARYIVRPLEDLTRAAHQLEQGARTDTIALPKNQSGEIGLLTRSFLSMATSLEERQINLEEKQSRITAILEAAPNTIITIDEKGIILDANSATSQLLGYSKNELIGSNVSMLMEEHHRVQHDNYLTNYSKTKVAGIIGKNREVEARRKDGSFVPVSLSISEVRLQNKKVFIGILTDLTEQKKVDRLKNEFVSTVSHELRTPLTAIKGSLGLLRSSVLGDLSDQAKGMIDIAYSNSDRLVRLINDILDIEKIEAGKMVFNFQRFQLGPLIERVIEVNKSYTDELNVNVKLLPVSEDIFVEADSDRISQVITNLISNAAKFSPKDESIIIKAERQIDMVRISITDKGPGISPEFQKKIFGKFAQADSSDTKTQGGTGLGLSISKSIVQNHGGMIAFDTALGQGTTFYFCLPISYSVASDPERDGKANVKKILICEDDPNTAYLLMLMIENMGFEADVCGNAKDAKKRLSEENYCAMTLDLSLPGQDGISLIRELREDPRTQSLPIVVVSARAGENAEQLKGDAYRVVDCLEKPIDLKSLRKGLQNAAMGHHEDSIRILCVEDDADDQSVISDLIFGSDTLDLASTCEEARFLLEKHDYQLVILDLDLPDGSGESLLQLINENGEKPPHILVFSVSEVSEKLSSKIDAALVKSYTTSEVLRRQIEHLIKAGEKREDLRVSELKSIA